MRKTLVALAVLVSAAAVTDKAKAGISDKTLIAIFGDGPTHIRRPVEECIRLATGLDDAIHKDTPKDVLGVLKTQCRLDLQQRLDDPSRNSSGLSLEDIEDQAVALRVTELRAEFKNAATAKYEAEQKDKSDTRKAAWLQKRDETLAHYSGLGATIDRLERLCGEWRSHREALPLKNRKGTWSRLRVCAEDVQADARKRAVDFVEKLKGLDDKAGEGVMNGYLLTPEFELQRFAPDKLEEAEERLKRQIEEMEAVEAS